MTQGYPQGQAPNPYGQTPNAYQQPAPYGQAPYGQAPDSQAPYGQAPYGQAPAAYGANPYGANPYDQPPGAYPAAPDAYQQPQAPYEQAPTPYPPQQSGGGQQGRNLPAAAGDFRRSFGGILDFVAAVVAGCAVAIGLVHKVHGVWWVLGIVAALLFSGANQVLLARLTGCSVGKFLMATRVMRSSDGGRPNTWELAQRWMVAGVVGWVATVVFDEAISEPDDFGGIRIVRWKHLRNR